MTMSARCHPSTAMDAGSPARQTGAMPQQITKRSAAESQARSATVLFDFEDPSRIVRDGKREEMAQGDDGEKRESKRRSGNDHPVDTFVFQRGRRHIEDAFDNPAGRQSGPGQEEKTMAAASYERFPNEGECGLFLRAANPGFKQTRAQLGKSVGLAVAFAASNASSRMRLVAVIAGEIGADSDERRDCDAQKRRSRAFGIAENDGLPEVEKPDAGPPFGVRLATGERDRAER